MGQEHRWRSGLACLAHKDPRAVQINVTVPNDPAVALCSRIHSVCRSDYLLTSRAIIFYPQIAQISTDSGDDAQDACLAQRCYRQRRFNRAGHTGIAPTLTKEDERTEVVPQPSQYGCRRDECRADPDV